MTAGNGVPPKVALLDVNVLIALFDAEHIHHEVAHDWFSDSRAFGWATCPLTENGFVRVMSNPSATSYWERPAAARDRLARFCESGGHVFWPDSISYRDAQLFSGPLAMSFRHTTDVYLLALACHHGGCLVTFDKGIPLTAVNGARREHLVVLEPDPDVPAV